MGREISLFGFTIIETERVRREIFCLLVYSPDGCNSQSCAKSSKSLSSWDILCNFLRHVSGHWIGSRAAGTQTLIWDTIVESGGLTHYVTILVPKYFSSDCSQNELIEQRRNTTV